MALRATQLTLREPSPNWDPWILFFLRLMQKHRDRLQEKIATEHLLEGKMAPLSQKILDAVRQNGSLQISQLESLLGEKRSTIKLRLADLVKRGKLARHGKGPATWYTSATVQTA